MKKIFLSALGIIIVFALVFPNSTQAQVSDEFEVIRVITGVPYNALNPDDANVEIAPAEDFALPPQFNTTDMDDGYYEVQIGFDFEFNGEIYNKLWINVNGFVTFGEKQGSSVKTPPFLPPKDQKALYIGDNSYPVNVIAPFWGDHYYRDENSLFQGYVPSKIMYTTNNTDQMVIEWNKLNINFRLDGEIVKSSVASFQVILKKSEDQFSEQGNIEFAYGSVGDEMIEDPRVITKGATIGIKGEGTIVGELADFLNGLYYVENTEDYDLLRARRDTSRRSTLWPPSGATDRRIVFNALGRYNIEEFWGDGDVDFSKAEGQRHEGMPQNRYVTVNDARLIIKSVATEIPLDPIRRRAAYHGDVNHNGRYYYDENGVRKNITWRNMNYADSLPDEISSIKQLRFEANEYDAAILLKYISGRVPYLPWIIDSIPVFGKVNQDVATGITFGNVDEIANNTYQVPVFLNGNINDAVGIKFRINGNVEDVYAVTNDYNKLMTSYATNVVVLSGEGMFSVNEPIAYVTFTSSEKELNVTDARFNDVNIDDQLLVLTSVNNSSSNVSLLENSPNPFSNTTNFNVNVEVAGNYQIIVYDLLGNKVKTIYNGMLEAGNKTIEWNGVNDNGETIIPGVYIYTLTGNNVSESQKLIYR
jgi:hypothetical protein